MTFPRRQMPDQPAGRGTEDILITTKFSAPPDRPQLVARPRLIRLLHEGIGLKLTLVSAPAGSGKTALLSQWSQLNTRPVAWLSLTPDDNDPGRFWSCVFTALQALHPGVGSDILSWLSFAPTLSSKSIIAQLVNALSAAPGPLVMVLDDYHVIESVIVHDGMALLLEHLPPNVHLVIASRTAPPLPVARMRGQNQLMELRAADLGFTLDETAAFLRDVMRLDLSPGDVTTLANGTEGWIAGLQLAALSLQKREDASGFIETFRGDNRHVFDYLVEEVLRRQPEDIQTFLLQTSTLERLSGSLCDAVTGRGDGQEILDMLENANLFTMPLDDKRNWHRYHHLFADVLRNCLHRWHPELELDLHRKASAWYHDHGLASEAVGHALKAHDFERAAELIEAIAPSMLSTEMRTLLDWLQALPEELVRSRPQCSIWQAWVLAACGPLSAAEARLQDVEDYLGLGDGAPIQNAAMGSRALPEGTKRLLAYVAVIRAGIAAYRRDFSSAVALSHRALELSQGDDGAVRSQIMHGLGFVFWGFGDVAGAGRMFAEADTLGQVPGSLASIAANLTGVAGIEVSKGRLHEAARIYEQALRIADREGNQSPMVTGAANIELGWLLYEWNDLDASAVRVTKGIELCEQGRAVFYALRGYGVMARVNQARGDFDGAYEALQKAEELARANPLITHGAGLTAYRVRLWLRQGDLEAAANWVEEIGLRADGAVSRYHRAEQMAVAEVWIAQNKTAEAAELLGPLVQTAEQEERIGDVIKVLARLSLVQHQEEGEQALATLKRALWLAEPGGYVRTFVDLGTPMKALLGELIEVRRRRRFVGQGKASQVYLRSLLAAFGSPPVLRRSGSTLAGVSQPMAEPLSARELQVLQLTAAGWSTTEIAQEFVVSVNTVRTHVKNSYGKLGVHKRSGALARARELGLLNGDAEQDRA